MLPNVPKSHFDRETHFDMNTHFQITPNYSHLLLIISGYSPITLDYPNYS